MLYKIHAENGDYSSLRDALGKEVTTEQVAGALNRMLKNQRF
jgi:hypothetical protein